MILFGPKVPEFRETGHLSTIMDHANNLNQG